jgi:predicted dehydrogenase
VLVPAVCKVPGVALRAVVTATGITASHAAERFGFASAATDPAAVLDASDVDVVIIATRHDSHAAFAVAALRAGKSVFCEKPLALDHEGLDAVAAAAAEAPGILAVGFNRRFAPLVVEMKEALRSRAGPLLMAYRVNAGPVPADSWIRGAQGGGRILGEVCHFVDLLAHLCASRPIEVHAIAPPGLDDAVSVLIRFADGSAGSITYSSRGDPAAPKELLDVFAGGTVLQLYDFARLDIFAEGRRRALKRRKDKGQAPLVAAFLDAVKQGRNSPIALGELVATTRATLAIETSLLTGRPEAV